MTIAGVYEIRNKINGKRYIGSASYIKDRFRTHEWNLERNRRRPNRIIQNAWNKYGSESFEFNILLICDPEMCEMFEQRAMDVLCPEYNAILQASFHARGMLRDEEWNNSISKALTGVPQPHVQGENNPKAKLTEKDVREIRRLFATSRFTYLILGKMFKVHLSQIHHIVKRKQWRHV